MKSNSGSVVFINEFGHVVDEKIKYWREVVENGQ
jgi:hypothetical protein